MSADGVPTTIWDTTAPRHLAIAGQVKLLFTETGVLLPRTVLDPNDPYGAELLRCSSSDLSEIAAAEAWHRRQYEASADNFNAESADNLAVFRGNPDIRVIDLNGDELDDAKVFASHAFANRHELDLPLGKGESAVLAIAMNRELRAGVDDGAARAVATRLDIPTVTTQEWLHELIERHQLSERSAITLWKNLRAQGFRGPEAF